MPIVSEGLVHSQDSKFRMWFIAARPWSYTAAFVPVALGAVMAWKGNCPTLHQLLLFVLTLLGGVCLQGAANFLNTYGDFVSGVDSKDHASCPHLVQGLVSPRAIRNAGIASLILGVLFGIYPVFCGGIPVLICGAIGVIGASCYTTGYYPFKYIGLGSVFVFFLMGSLMVIPSWYIQMGGDHLMPWVPFLGSLPVSCLVMAIMHGNEMRDIESDRNAGIVTFAMRLGLRRAIILYKVLFIGAYLLIVLLILIGIFNIGALLPFVIYPIVHKQLSRLSMNTDPVTMQWLAKQTGKLHFLFGTLLVVGLIVGNLIR